MSVAKEFREFAMRGNVIDLAVGVVIGAAFGKIVSSLVEDVLMPPIGLAIGGVDFSNLFLTLGGGDVAFETVAAAKEAGVATINYGIFLNTLIQFVIVAFAIFMVVKLVNRLKRNEPGPPAAPTTKACAECASNIPLAARRCAFCTSVVAG